MQQIHKSDTVYLIVATHIEASYVHKIMRSVCRLCITHGSTNLRKCLEVSYLFKVISPKNQQPVHFRSKQKCTRYGFQGKKHYAASHTNPELPKFTFGGVLPNTIPLNGHFNHFLFCQFDCPQLVSRTSSNCEIKGDNNLTMVHPIQILIASKATF